MVIEATKIKDFSQPVEADFIVALKAKNQEYALFVEAFRRKRGKPYLVYTSDIRAARRFSKLTAFDVLKEATEYRVIGRVERVMPDGQERLVVQA